MRRRWEEDEDQPSWFWRFLKGVMVSVVVCGAAIAVISLYVLPPAELPPEPTATTEPAEPAMIGGIEVSSQPAYSTPTAPAAPPEEFGPVTLPGPALSVNAVPFEAEAETPLVAVVLDDAAADPLLHPLMLALSVPVTVGVVAAKDGDRVTAQAARQAGFEVVAQLPLLAPGASVGGALEYGLPADEAERRTDLLMRRLPMAVAATRPLSARATPDLAVLQGIGAALAGPGFAYLDHGVALIETAPGELAGLTVPVAAGRFVIPDGDDLGAMIAVLDAAAADATIRGGAVVMATPSETLYGALLLWGGEGSVNAAQLAPLSAVIGRLAGQ